MKFLASVVLASWAVTTAASLPPGPVDKFPIGRCVKVAGVTAPEDAKTAGFEYLELALQDALPLSDDDFELMVKRLHGLGLPALSGYGFVPGALKVVGPDVKPVEVSNQIERGLARARRLGVKYVVFGNLNNKSRQFPEGFPMEQAHAQLLAFARESAEKGKKQGITVLIEPLPVSQTNLINTVPEALAFVGEVARPNLKMLVDYAYMRIGKEDMAILEKAAPYIRQVEISNPNGRVYPQVASESDYVPFFRALRKGGYHGGVSVHGKPNDFFVDAPRAIALLRTLVVQGGRP